MRLMAVHITHFGPVRAISGRQCSDSVDLFLTFVQKHTPVFYITLSYITLSNYLVYASLLSLLQLFFCLHVRLLYAIKYYLLTYLLTICQEDSHP